MRARSFATMAALILVAVVVPASAHGQAVFQVEGGGSTLGSGYGSRVQFWSGDYEGWLGGGWSRGWRTGAFVKHQLGSPLDTVRLGFDVQPIGFATDLFAGGTYVLTQGVAWRRKRGTFDATLFGGATGAGIGAPYVNTARADKALGMLRLAWRPSAAWLLETHAVGARRQTLLETASWTSPYRTYSLGTTAGVGANKPFGALTWRGSGEYADVRLGYTAFAAGFHRADAPLPNLAEPFRENALVTLRLPRRAMLTLGHQNYRQEDTTGAAATRAVVNQASANVILLGATLGAGVFQTSSNTGRSLSTFNSVSRPLPFNTTGAVLFFQTFNPATAPIRTLQGELREPISHTLSLSQVFARTGTSVSGGLGGRYQHGYTTIAFDYQNFYVPLRQPNPFMRALTLTVRLQLWNASASVGTAVDPFGRVSYTAAGSAYLSIGDLAGSGVAPIPLQLEHYLIRGTVEDDHGAPVDGAAIKVGNELATTNSRGEFFVRTNSQHALPLAVSFDDFLAVGDYEVLIAPATATPAEEAHATPVRIVLRGRRAEGIGDHGVTGAHVGVPPTARPGAQRAPAAATEPTASATPNSAGAPAVPAAPKAPIAEPRSASRVEVGVPRRGPVSRGKVSSRSAAPLGAATSAMPPRTLPRGSPQITVAQRPVARRRSDAWRIIERPLPYIKY